MWQPQQASKMLHGNHVALTCCPAVGATTIHNIAALGPLGCSTAFHPSRHSHFASQSRRGKRTDQAEGADAVQTNGLMQI